MTQLSEISAQSHLSTHERIAAADTALGFNLLALTAKQTPGKNILLSPLGAALVLSMAPTGARTDTLLEMQKVLNVGGLTMEEVNAGNVSLLDSLLKPDELQKLAIADSVWVNQRMAVKSSFIASNQTIFRGDVLNVDFTDSATAPKLNSWVQEHTANRISEIVQAPLPPDTALILLNAIYFKAPWSHPFDTNLTRDMPFKLANGQEILHPRMSHVGLYSYFENSDLQIVALPYRERFYMYVLLPKGPMDGLIAKLGPRKWTSWIQGMRDKKVSVELPRFQLKDQHSLNQALKGLGMRRAFELSTADFQGVSAEPIFISSVLQTAFVDVNEKGTEATAATVVRMSRGGVSPSIPPVDFIVDHPFIIAVGYERATGFDESEGILFLGLVMNPKWT